MKSPSQPRDRGIPEATVARLPVYLRALNAMAERGIATVSRGSRRGRRGQLGQAPQGPVPPRLLRHPRRRLRRRVPASTRSPASSASPRTGPSPSSASVTWATRWPTTAASPPAASASPPCSTPTPNVVGDGSAGLDRASTSTSWRPSIKRRGVSIGCIATPAGRGPGGVRPLVAAGVTSILNFAPGRAVRAGRRRRPQGRPRDRAADPGVPRAAQSRRGALPEVAELPAMDGRSICPARVGACRRMSILRRRCSPPHARTSRSWSASPLDPDARSSCSTVQHDPVRRRRPWCSRPATGSRSTRPSTASTAASTRSPRCSPTHRASRCDELAEHLYVHYEERRRRSTCSGSRCGLDSMVVGEAQILGQAARRAHASARTRGPSAPTLNELIQQALRVGKRAHTETGIDTAGRLAGQRRPRRARRELGAPAGAPWSSAPARWRRWPPPPCAAPASRASSIANRTYERGRAAGRARRRHGGRARRPSPALADGRPRRLLHRRAAGRLTAEMIRRRGAGGRSRPGPGAAARRRPGRRAASRRHAGRPGDDPAPAGRRGGREHDIDEVRAQIVAEEVARLPGSQRAAEVAPTVVALRPWRASVVDAELRRLDARLPELDDAQRAEVAQTVRRVVDKLLHSPTVRVKRARRRARRRRRTPRRCASCSTSTPQAHRAP